MTNVCMVLHPYTARKDLGAGHDRYAFELIQRLGRHNVELSLLESGQIKSIPKALLAEAKAVVRLRRMKENAVYHATATANAMAPITAGKSPIVTTIHDVLWFFVKSNYDKKFKYYLKTSAIKRAAERSDAIIVPFQSTADFLSDELGANKERLHLVPYGVDHDQFFPLEPDEVLPRPQCLGTKEGPTVLFVGAVNYGKGIDTLINCFAAVVAQVPDAQLVIGSDGWDLPLIRAIRESSPVKNSIRFVGFIPEADLRAAYIHADVTCFPSRYGFGLATLESMACGTPTVSGRTLDAPEFVGDAGLMANPDDADELADQLIKALVDSELRATLVQKGIQKAGKYKWDLTAEATAKVYRQVSL